ncbi:MAG: hypothetical protein RLZZ172_573 [Bacteroidota bacterium]
MSRLFLWAVCLPIFHALHLPQAMEKYFYIILSAFVLGSVPSSSFAQDKGVGQLLVNASADHLRFMREHAAIYNGAEYVGYGQQINGHPYFGSDSLHPGDLVYEGVLYKSIPLFYDLVEDAVLIQSFSGSHFIRLNNAKVSSFVSNGAQFVKTPLEAIGIPGGGFLQVLHQGSFTVYARKKKVLVSKNNGDRPVMLFQQFNSYLVASGENWKTVSSRRDLTNLFPNQHDALRSFLSSQKLRFKKNPETMLKQSAALLEQLMQR